MAHQFRGKYLLSSSAREDAITCLAFSINGDYIAIGGLDRKLQIFALASGQLHYTIVAPSPIKSLIWLPGAEQTLICACQSGILINIIIRAGATMNFCCFRAKLHTIDFMAADASAIYLATGRGADVRIWKAEKHYEWRGHALLGVPKTSADNCDAEIILTGLHWRGNANASASDARLITTYRHHGIQLWDVVKMSVVQSINMSSPLLGSSLSPNGLQISTTKRGGYDLYDLDTGIVLHTFLHDLPLAVLGGDKYPSMFLLRGFAFCGATVDGTVTLWDVKVGDRLQSVQHLCATLHAIAVHAGETTGIVLLATASHSEVKVWHAISGAIRRRHHQQCDHEPFTKATVAVACAIAICVISVLLKRVF